MENLTRRQEEILTYVKEYIVSHGYPPTVREIGKDLGVSSPATIHTHLNNNTYVWAASPKKGTKIFHTIHSEFQSIYLHLRCH